MDLVQNPEVVAAICEFGACPFCFQEIECSDAADSCEHCGGDVFPPEMFAEGIECCSCRHMNQLPWPLDQETFCEKCGEGI
jgi:hypothetical protein